MRIKSYPTQPHISIAAAQAYVRLASGRSKDLRAKMNAQKTLSQLQDLYAPPAIPAQLTGPEPILSQFVEMQMGGIGLTQDGSAQLDAFLVHPAQEPRAKVGVARAYVVKKASVALNKGRCIRGIWRPGRTGFAIAAHKLGRSRKHSSPTVTTGFR